MCLGVQKGQDPLEKAIFILVDAIEWGHIDQLGKRVEIVLGINKANK